jgi:alpha,alpha-trehalase
MVQMLARYVAASDDSSILDRALPLAEVRPFIITFLTYMPDDVPQRELAWWSNNRSLDVTSPYTNKTYTLSRYAVTNSAPRPESYLTGTVCHVITLLWHAHEPPDVDYQIANDPTLSIALDESQRAELYSEFASGAESGLVFLSLGFQGWLTGVFLGWDFSTRFISLPVAGGTNNTAPALRSLNIKNHIPVDLNSILCKLRVVMKSRPISSSTQIRPTLSLRTSMSQGSTPTPPPPINTVRPQRTSVAASLTCFGILQNWHSTTSI